MIVHAYMHSVTSVSRPMQALFRRIFSFVLWLQVPSRRAVRLTAV
jgi:hypothetical protein